MSKAIKKRQDVEPALRRFEQEAALVEGACDGGWSVRCRSGELRAERAASCLVQPRAGDKVLVAFSEDRQEAYILAVLRRADARAPTELVVEGEMKIATGRLEVAAADGIRLLTASELETSAKRMRMHAEDAALFVKSMTYLGHEVVGKVKAVKIAGSMLDGAWQTVRQTAKRLYRTTTETEQVRAQNRDVRCDNLLTMHSDNAAMTAKKLIKMDAGQIVMG